MPDPARRPNVPGATEAQSTGAPQPRPFALPRPPLAPTPPAKHSTFLREQTSHRQAHGQTHRHSHAPTPRETAGRGQLLSQSHSTCERPGPEERTGGQVSGETQAEIHEASETNSKMARGRYRQTDTHHTHTHTHTHTHLSVILGNTSVHSCWVEPNFSTTHGLRPIRLLCPWHFPGGNTGVGCHFLLQGIFPTQESNPSLLRADALPSEPGYC